MKKNKFIALFVFLAISSEIFGQLSVSSYSIYALGVNTTQNKKLSGELKVFGNRLAEDILLEPTILFNFAPKEYHRFSVGIGLNFMPLGSFDRIYALTVPMQLQIFPLTDMKKLSLLIELTPEFIVEETINLRHLWGFRYSFGS